MDRDKLVDILTQYGLDVIRKAKLEWPDNIPDIGTPLEAIEKLIAPELEKAEKWNRVKEAADSRPPCKCPLWYNDACNLEYGGCIFRDVVDALTEKEK